MDITTIVVVALVSGFGYNYLMYKTKMKKLEIKHGNNDEKYAEEIESLKDRIATLEKIVTDEKYQLDREIKGL